MSLRISEVETIVADGTYLFDGLLRRGTEAVVEVAGAFGSGTVTLGYVGAAGAFVAYQDDNGDAIALSAPGGRRVDVPASGRLAFLVADATAPSIKIAVTKVRD
jgi:hypothetical protein